MYVCNSILTTDQLQVLYMLLVLVRSNYKGKLQVYTYDLKFMSCYGNTCFEDLERHKYYVFIMLILLAKKIEGNTDYVTKFIRIFITF